MDFQRGRKRPRQLPEEGLNAEHVLRLPTMLLPQVVKGVALYATIASGTAQAHEGPRARAFTASQLAA